MASAPVTLGVPIQRRKKPIAASSSRDDRRRETSVGPICILQKRASGKLYQARYWHEREFETVGKIQEIAEQQGTPMATLSVAWILANPAITSVILGASHIDQLTDTLAAADYQFDSVVKAQLDDVSIEYRRGDAGK